MSTRTSRRFLAHARRALAASLIMVPLAASAVAQAPTQQPVPLPLKDVFTSVSVYDDFDVEPLAGVAVMLKPTGHRPILGTTGARGNTEFYALPNGTHVECTLHESPIDGGVVLGMKTDFDVFTTGHGYLSYSKAFTQPKVHSMVIDDNGVSEQHFYPADRDYPFWEVNVPAQSGIQFCADIGMLVNADVVAQTLAYYGYPGDASQYERGLVMRVNTPGGAPLGDDGLGLVMHNFGPDDYATQQLDVVHFVPQGDTDAIDAVREAAASSFVVSYKALDIDSQALYYLGGDMPEGYLFFLWRDGKVDDHTVIESYPLDTPVFDGDKGQGIDKVDLTGAVPIYLADNCTDCDPGLPNFDPSWTCDPGQPSGWTKFWSFGCPGDGTPVGGVVCQQWALPVSPIFCVKSGSIELCVKSSQSFSVKAKLTGGEVGGSVTVEESLCTTANIDPGPNGCGECVRLYGVGLICGQEFSNWDDVVCNEGGYCFGTTWTKPCHEYDPVFTHCVDVKITVTSCPRT
ncbi:MAG: hypothetical protein H6825_07040 [Planctomycetes bacterium]|nr:hypothetical protein [Planctomycetota bacterium]